MAVVLLFSPLHGTSLFISVYLKVLFIYIIVLTMRIPFANRTADVDLPAAIGQPKVTIKNVIDDFRAQVPSNFAALFEAFVLLSPRKVRITCRSPRALEEAQHLGLAFRNKGVTFHPCRTAKWVNVTRLSYGVPSEAVQAALSPYGKILTIKMDSYQGVYVGVRNVLMEITAPIPSNIRIADHWCNVFYPGQIPTCFKCRQSGHTRAKCPQVDRLDEADVSTVDAAVEAAPSPARRTAVTELVDSVLDRVITGQATFAEVVGLGAVSETSGSPELEIGSAGQDFDPGPWVEVNPVLDTVVDGNNVADGGLHLTPDLKQDLVDSGSESSDSDSSELFEDAQHVDDFPSGKRDRSSGSGSDDSGPELSQAHKKGKEIQVDLMNLQYPQSEGEALAVDVAAGVPLPIDDSDNDDDDATLASIVDTPKDSDNKTNTSLYTDTTSKDFSFTKPTPRGRGHKSQITSQPPTELLACRRTRTSPRMFSGSGRGRSSSQPPSRGSNC